MFHITMRIHARQLLDRASAYTLIRSMCTPSLNAILAVDENFIAVEPDDPLSLLKVIKTIVTSRCDGNIELERSHALRDWCTLTMHNGEDLIVYGTRATKLFDRLTTAGVTEAQLPSPKEQSMRVIDGLSSSVQSYTDYRNFLSDSMECSKVDIYPATLVEAINGVTRFHKGRTKGVVNPPTAALTQTALGAKAAGKEKKKEKTPPVASKDPEPKGKSVTFKDEIATKKKEEKFTGDCFNCGKPGHYASECRGKKKVKDLGTSHHTTYVSRKETTPDHTQDEDTFYTTFGVMNDEVDEEESDPYDRSCSFSCTGAIPGNPSSRSAHMGTRTHDSTTEHNSTEAIFDSGATGTIIACESVLTDVATCTPTVFKGLHGSLRVTQAGQLGEIGIVHFDPRAELSIVSASDCLLQGHEWEFRRGNHVNQDAFLLHTQNHTYRFQHREGLYVTDLGSDPEPRYADAPFPRMAHAHPTTVRTPRATALYTAKLQTTTENESQYTKREVSRSTKARRLQASLGFPPDTKLISALRAGAFLNCDV